MADLTAIERALKKARRAEDLTPDERAELREVLEWWHGWKAMGRVGKLMLWLMISLGAAAAAYSQIVEGARRWLSGS